MAKTSWLSLLSNGPSSAPYCATQFDRVVSQRRYPPPWSIEDIGAAFVVKNGAGQQLPYVYFEDEPGRRSAAKLLSKDEARRMLLMANLPEIC
jgi:hypothetical protein